MLNGYLQLGDSVIASISTSTARNSVSYGVSARVVFEALANSTLNLSDVVLEQINSALDSIGQAWSGAIAGQNATLHMVRSSISQAAAAAGAVVWSGGTANVVSSLISQSGPPAPPPPRNATSYSGPALALRMRWWKPLPRAASPGRESQPWRSSLEPLSSET